MIKVKELSYTYSDGTQALKNINVNFPEEHIFAIMGLSGSGKTTLLNCLARFLAPQQGAIYLDNVDIDDDMPDVVSIDQQKVEQIIKNFMSNALKFTSNGSITVNFHKSTEEKEKDVICISVIDTGIGIPKEKLDSIFDSFTQLEKRGLFGGSGLGLSIVKQLTDLLESDLEVKSVEGEGSTFSFTLSDGSLGHGIPSILPTFEWPWLRVQPNENALSFSWDVASDLLSAAFAIAMLGAIESLLCAVVLDGMSGTKHSANSELLGQGIGNVVTPFFGGITSTAAIARSAANFKAGAVTPISAMIHAVVILISLLSLSTVLSYIPMSGMASLLLVVAWNMSEAPKIIHLLKKAPINEIAVFITCFFLTVFFDMVVAIVTGIVLASLLFMKQIAEMTKVHDITNHQQLITTPLPKKWKVYKINGPLFFAAADTVFGELSHLCNNKNGVVLYFDGVSILDTGGVAALYKFIDKCKNTQTTLYLADFQFQPLKTLAKAKFTPDSKYCIVFSTLAGALKEIPRNK